MIKSSLVHRRVLDRRLLLGITALALYVAIGVAYSLMLSSETRYLDEGWILSISENVQATSYALGSFLLSGRRDWGAVPWIRLEILLLVNYVTAAFTQAIFITRIRFRMPFDLLLIILIARHLTAKNFCLKFT